MVLLNLSPFLSSSLSATVCQAGRQAGGPEGAWAGGSLGRGEPGAGGTWGPGRASAGSLSGWPGERRTFGVIRAVPAHISSCFTPQAGRKAMEPVH